MLRLIIFCGLSPYPSSFSMQRIRTAFNRWLIETPIESFPNYYCNVQALNFQFRTSQLYSGFFVEIWIIDYYGSLWLLKLNCFGDSILSFLDDFNEFEVKVKGNKKVF